MDPGGHSLALERMLEHGGRVLPPAELLEMALRESGGAVGEGGSGLFCHRCRRPQNNMPALKRHIAVCTAGALPPCASTLGRHGSS